MQSPTLSLILAAVLAGCANNQPTEPEPKAAEPKTAAVLEVRGDDYDLFGAGVAEKAPAMTVAALAANSKTLSGTHVRLTGTVQSVCKKKGCWMRLTEGDKAVFVKFKDYAYFMPLDCEGREAVLEGTFTVKETPVEELKHYLEDEGKHEEAEKVTEPKLEMQVLADGVALRKQA